MNIKLDNVLLLDIEIEFNLTNIQVKLKLWDFFMSSSSNIGCRFGSSLS